MSKTQPDQSALSDFRITFRSDWMERVRAVVLSGGGEVNSFAAGKGGALPGRMVVRITQNAVATLRLMSGVTSVDQIH